MTRLPPIWGTSMCAFLPRVWRVFLLVMWLTAGMASDHIGPGPWVELTGFVDDVRGAVVVVQGIEVDISRADVNIWQPLEAGFLVEVEGWLDTGASPMVLIASEFDLEGIGYDYERSDGRGLGQGNRNNRDDWDDDWDND